MIALSRNMGSCSARRPAGGFANTWQEPARRRRYKNGFRLAFISGALGWETFVSNGGPAAELAAPLCSECEM